MPIVNFVLLYVFMLYYMMNSVGKITYWPLKTYGQILVDYWKVYTGVCLTLMVLSSGFFLVPILNWISISGFGLITTGDLIFSLVLIFFFTYYELVVASILVFKSLLLSMFKQWFSSVLMGVVESVATFLRSWILVIRLVINLYTGHLVSTVCSSKLFSSLLAGVVIFYMKLVVVSAQAYVLVKLMSEYFLECFQQNMH